jgi:uncharacterized protein YprB with RNaseH-like and TPR domain
MDIRSKLGLYRENTGSKPAVSAEAGRDIQDTVRGSIRSNEYGAFYMAETRYPAAMTHGGRSLGAALDVRPGILSMLGGEDCGVSAERLIFLDTETTGLSGGAGTVAFLIGAGSFENGDFVVRQYFMRDYDEETAMLHEFNRSLSGCSGLVTFNGKAFDWNLLQGRFVANRLRPLLRDPVHIDLLYPSRRIWGLKLESCRLSSLEENVLGEFRTDDIPGMMIPGVYFKYLEDRNAADIKRVIKHNELDILSMVSLLAKISAMLESPLAQSDSSHELLGLGRIYEAGGGHDRAVDCLETCSASDIPSVRTAAVKRLTRIYKKSGRYDRALGHWRELASEAGIRSLFPLVELAMYYEHREKNIAKALECVERAIHLSLQSGLTEGRQFPELRKRQERLKRKAARYGV